VAVELEELSQVLLNIVSEKTGYPVEMLELPMDMESELGIDSIKRVEILGALLELYPGLPQPDPEQLGVLRTLGEVAEYMLNQVQQLGTSGSNPPEIKPVEDVPVAGAPVAPQTTAIAPTTTPTDQDNQYPRQTPIEQSLVTIASAKTGYPPEALGLGMDLTSELGIDTVKLTEIVTSLLEQYPDLTRPDPARLAELSTLGHILELVQAPDPVPAEKKNLPTAAYNQSRELEDPMLERLQHSQIQRSPVRLKALPQPDALDFNLPAQTIALLTDDGTPTTVKLAEALHQRGWPVVVLSFPTDLIPALPTSPSLPEGVSRVQLRELSEAHLQEQLAAITARYGAIGAFIHLHPASPEAESLYREQDAALLKQVFLWAKHLKGELEQTAAQGRSCFLTVARLDGALGLGQQRFGAIAAGLFGLTKTLAQEWPNVFCRAIDLHPDLGVDASVWAILAELHDPSRLIREVGYSAIRQRSTLVCEPAELLAMGQGLTPRQQNIHQNSVFLVSGGGKGITAQCALAIAQRYHCKFILLGRSSIAEPEPAWAAGYDNEADLKKQIVAQLSLGGQKVTPIMVQQQFNAIASRREISQTLTAIQTAGGEAAYLNVDVTDAPALQTQLAPVIARLGPVTGIIHGAGNLADKRIEKKTEQDYEKVYAAKVRGLEYLLACVNLSQLNTLVLFSSVVGFYGNIGQSDYAMANEILNKSAHLLQQQLSNCHVVAINWGPWDSGMVSPELKKAFAERNVFTIPTDIGAAFLLREISAADQPVTQVVIGSPLLYIPDTIPLGLNRYRIRRHLTVEANPFLLDHAIAGRPVLPATCALTWMINICEQLYPGYQLYQCQNYKVLKGIAFDDNYIADYILDLQEVRKSETGEIEFAAKICSEPEGKLRYHFSSQLLLRKTPPTPSRYQQVDLSLDQNFPADNAFYQSGSASLFHGPIFQGVKRVLNISPQKLTMEVYLPSLSEQQQGQFPLQITNPYIADVQIHAHWIWSQFFHQQACLPAEIACYEQFAPTPFDQTIYVSAEIKSKTDSGMVLDVIAHNREGYIYNRMVGAKGTILPLNLDQKSFVKDVVTRRLQPAPPMQPPVQVAAPANH
jgi:polyketide-type polyunsaturated fatty acid synthase PfaA